MDLSRLLPYATPRQAECIEAAIQHGGTGRAGKALGVSRSSIRDAISGAKKKAAAAGYSPEHDLTHPVAPGQALQGASTLYGPDGDVKLQWVKSKADLDAEQELLDQAVEAACSSIKREKAVAVPKKVQENLLNLYVLTDYHIGMRSWPDETGEDWDTKIAEDLLYRWFSAAISCAPAADTGVFAQLGDFLHYDGLEAVTPASKHILDADTRYQHLVRVAIRAIRRIVRDLLKKHSRVIMIMADANHDEAGSAWLRELFHALYEDEPRVTVDRSADTYYCVEWGATSLFFHHGHKKKPEHIDDVMAAKFREVFGRTKHSYAHMGHMHFGKLLETNLMVVEQHRTLAAKDAYASRGGYMSGRSASVISYDKDHGEVGRVTLTPEMV